MCKGSRVSYRLLAASLLCFSLWGGTSTTQSEAQGGGELSTGGEKQRRLCGEPSGSKTRVLIGRFLLFGDFDPSLTRSLEQAFIGSLIWGLATQDDLSVFVWGRDFVDLREFRDLPLLINDAFIGGVRELEQDKQQGGRTSDLSGALEKNSCEYLFGGRISKEGALISITPYLLQVATGKMLRPFGTASVSNISLVPKVADTFSADLVSWLRARQGRRPSESIVEVGCFDLADTVSTSLQPLAEIHAARMQRRMAQDLANLKKLQFRISSDKTAVCAQPRAEPPVEVAAVVSGTIGIRDQKGADERSSDLKEIEVSLTIRLIWPDNAGRPLASETSVGSFKGPLSAAAALTVEFSALARSFLLAIRQEDGSFPSSTDFAQAAQADPVSTLRLTLEQGKTDRAIIAAFRELARNPRSGLANLTLGKTFQRKQETDLALQYFLRAKEATTELTLAARAELNEGLGEVYLGQKNSKEAVEYLLRAKNFYASDGRGSNAVDASRKLARAFYESDSKDQAVAELTTQDTLNKDHESLRLLGWIYASSSEYGKAEEWLTKAHNLNPTDEETRALLADIYDAMGRVALTAQRFGPARTHFGKALQFREDGRLLYLSGVSAFELGEFRDAIRQFERVISLSAEKTSLTWTEAGWLTLLECYLLVADYSSVEARGEAASSALASLRDSHLLVAYMRFLARVLSDPVAEPTKLKQHAAYKAIENAPTGASAKNLNWTNARIDEYLSRQALNPTQKGLIDAVNRLVWRDPKGLR